MPKSVYIVDGHAQIYRAYYAPFGNLSAPSGEPTRATHVFCQMMMNLVRDRRPDFLVMVLDVSDETVFRKQLDPQYKAHRDPGPEDLPVQERRILQIMDAVGLQMLKAEGFEADDIIATLVRLLAGADIHIHIVSRDKDLDQLLSENVSLYDPLKDEVITPARLVETKGWTPAQAIEAQTLIGDTVDNVPGVVGVGPKKAAALIQKYGSAANVIACAHELTPKLRESVLAFAPNLERTRQLLRLRDDVPVRFDLAQADIRRLRWSAARPIYAELGFRRLVEQLPQIASPEDEAMRCEPAPSVVERSDVQEDWRAALPPQEPLPAPLFARSSALLPAGDDLKLPDGGDYRLVNTWADFELMLAALSRQRAFVLDTETTEICAMNAELVGVSLSWEVGRGYYVPVRSVYGEVLALDKLRGALAPLFADPARTKVGHHLKYDALVLRKAGLPVQGPMFDTMIAGFLLDPLGSSSLDSMAKRHLNHDMIPIADLIGRGRDQLRLDQVPLAQVAEYSAEDADYTWRLYRYFEPQLSGSDLQPLFEQIEIPLLSVLGEMEYNGVRIDVPFLQEMGRRMASRIEELAKQVQEAVGGPFNLDSPKQLAEVLFDRLGFRVVRRTKTARSTDADTLEILAAETGHPALKLLLEYRELQKLRGTYVDALPSAIIRSTGRIHTSFHQTGAITGRLSSSEPNLQNIPIRTELGREIRRAFVPRTSDELLVVADYSQVELRVLAHFCGDEELIRAFAEDRDIHAFVASQVNNVPLEAVTREMRGRAKAVNFGIIYGQTAFGLSQTTGMSRSESQQFIDDYFRRYPRVRGYIEQCVAAAKRDGYVQTILGRRRPIENLSSANRTVRAQGERLAVNTVMQGSAADLIKRAMVWLHERIRTERLPLRMLLQVHDELVCEAPRGEAAEMGRIVADVMTHAIELRVPLKVDVATGENWLEAK